MSCSCGLLSLRTARASLDSRDNGALRRIWSFRIRSLNERDYNIKNEEIPFNRVSKIYMGKGMHANSFSWIWHTLLIR